MLKVLVTGCTGFIGNHVVDRFLELGCDVVASSRSAAAAQERTWFDRVTYREYSIAGADNKDLFDYFGRPDALIHLAWPGLPNYGALFHIETNLWNDYFFLKNLIEHGLDDVTVAGTCFEYGMREGCLDEDDESLPTNPYGAAKDALRRFLQELGKHHAFRLKWARLFYIYGDGQSQNSLIPQLLQAVERGDAAFDMSPGDQVRDFMPIETVARNICAITLQKKITGIINCCSGRPVEVKDFVADYCRGHGLDIELNLGVYPYSDVEPFSFWGSTEKLNRIEGIEV